jgi:hypothetical protein
MIHWCSQSNRQIKQISRVYIKVSNVSKWRKVRVLLWGVNIAPISQVGVGATLGLRMWRNGVARLSCQVSWKSVDSTFIRREQTHGCNDLTVIISYTSLCLSTTPWRRTGVVVSGQLHSPAALPPGERAAGTHWIGGRAGPRAGMDTVSKRKISGPRRNSNPAHPIVQPVVSRYTDWAIRALYHLLYSYVHETVGSNKKKYHCNENQWPEDSKRAHIRNVVQIRYTSDNRQCPS